MSLNAHGYSLANAEWAEIFLRSDWLDRVKGLNDQRKWIEFPACVAYFQRLTGIATTDFKHLEVAAMIRTIAVHAEIRYTKYCNPGCESGVNGHNVYCIAHNACLHRGLASGSLR